LAPGRHVLGAAPFVATPRRALCRRDDRQLNIRSTVEDSAVFALARQPVEIAVNSGASAETIIFSVVGAIFGSLVVAGAAVLAARLAARTANERQEKQLSADFDRHKAQLAHERKLRSEEHIRNAIDMAAIAVHEQLSCLSGLSVPLINENTSRARLREKIENATDEEIRKDLRKELHERLQALHESSAEVIEQKKEMLAIKTSLQLRLPVKDPIVLAYQRFADAYDAHHMLLQKGIKSVLTDKDQAEIVGTHDTFEGALRNFLVACHAWFVWLQEPEPPGPAKLGPSHY
jgi:hypothetical protein